MIGSSFVGALACAFIAAALVASIGCEGGLASTEGSGRSARSWVREASGGKDRPAVDRPSDDDGNGQYGDSWHDEASPGPASDEADGAGPLPPLPPKFTVSVDGIPDPPEPLDRDSSQDIETGPRLAPLAESDPDSAKGYPAIDDVWPNKAPAAGGDRVEIRGRNLQGFLVTFGFAPARILGRSESDGTVTLTVAVPAAKGGPSDVRIVARNRDGSFAIASEPFRYYN